MCFGLNFFINFRVWILRILKKAQNRYSLFCRTICRICIEVDQPAVFFKSDAVDLHGIQTLLLREKVIRRTVQDFTLLWSVSNDVFSFGHPTEA
jgi:hypothetical protein